MLRPNTKDRILTGEALLHPFFSKPGEYYDSTITTRSDEETESQQSNLNETEEEKKKVRLDSKRSSKLCDTLDARLQRITLSEAPSLKNEQALFSRQLKEPENIPTSPSMHLTGMDNSLKVPVASPLSSFHSVAYSSTNSKEGQEGEDSPQNEKCAKPLEIDVQREYDGSVSPLSQHPIDLIKPGRSEDVKSSNEDESKWSHNEESKKEKRPRPQTFHESMFRTKGTPNPQESGHALDYTRLPTASLSRKVVEEKKESPWKETALKAKAGYEIMANKMALDNASRDWNTRKAMPTPSLPEPKESEAESLDYDLQSVASKAHQLHMELQQYHDTRSNSQHCSASSNTSEEETEELAARLDEMGVLAANLTRMVEESKNKLSLIKETKMTRSAASFHRADRSCTSIRMPSTSHSRQYSVDESDKGIKLKSMHGQSSFAEKALPPATPSLTSKSKVISTLTPASLRRKISITQWARKDSISSTIPFPSESPKGAVKDQNQSHEEICVNKTTSREEREPWTTSLRGEGQIESASRSHLSRISSSRGRALSHFLTRYGSRSNKGAFQSSSDVAEDGVIKTSSTLYDKSGSSESFYSSIVGPGKGKATTSGRSPSEGKSFFDEEGVVHVDGNSEDKRQQRYLQKGTIEQNKDKSPVKSSQYPSTPAMTNRRISRVGESPIIVNQPPPLDPCAKRPVIGGDANIKSPTGKSLYTNQSVTPATGGQRGRTLSNMKSFTLRRSNSSKAYNQEVVQSPRLGQAESRHKRDLTVDTTIRLLNREEAVEPSNQRPLQNLHPLTPSIGEDPPRHSIRSRDSSSHSNQSHHFTNSPSTPGGGGGGGGLWNRLFRANTSNTSSRIQSPRIN